jgi:LacI family transcriptional regulator
MAASVTDIARKTGVSKALVSRVLREDRTLRVSEERRKQILAVARTMGGVERTATGRVARKIRSYNIAIPCHTKEILKELQAHWENQAHKNFKSILAENVFRLSIDLHETGSVEDRFRDYVPSRGLCDGIVLLKGVVDESVAEFVLKHHIPHVSTDYDGRMYGLNTVVVDAATGLAQAVMHLKKLGHRRIGYVGRRYYTYPYYMAAMARFGLDTDPSWLCVSPPEDELPPDHDTEWSAAACRAFGKWLDAGGDVTAVCCHNDYGAFGVIEAMKQRGLTPGKDISIVGHDNIEVRGLNPSKKPFLTTIDFSLAEIGRRLGEVLLSQVLYNRRQIVHENLPVQLIVRESTGPCPEK